MTSWTRLANEATEGDAVDVLGQLTHVAVQMAKAIASQAGEGWEVGDVLHHLALDAEQDDGGTTPS